MLKKLLSYLLPIKIYQKESAISKKIEIIWNNGKLLLDSENANYSYGSLQRILRKGLKKIGLEKIASMKAILVLGVAGGSVIKTLVNEMPFKGKITGVEIDPEIITIANDYFNLNKIKNLEIIIDDASQFVFKTNEKYDLIIIDIFQDTAMPDFLFEESFANQIAALLNNKGFMLFNTMCLQEKDKERNKKYLSNFNQKHFVITTMPRIEVYNELILIEKIA